MSNNSERPSNLGSADIAYAAVYAFNKQNYDQCENKILMNNVAKTFNISDTNSLYTWIQNKDIPYPCTSTDPSECPAGTCSITSQDLCQAVGNDAYPFNEDQFGNPKPDLQLKNTPFVAWRETPWSNGEPKCVIANPISKRWCISPGSRNDKSVNGLTNVPPFSFNDTTGKCNMSQGYCEWMDQTWDASTKTCIETKGQEAAQFFIGKTIFAAFKNLVENKSLECRSQTSTSQSELKKDFSQYIKNHINTLQENYQKIDKEYKRLVDDKMIKEKYVFRKDVIPGINLYMVKWKDESPTEFKPGFSFIASEIEKVYPQYIKKENGLKYLVIPKQDISKPEIKRLYGFNVIGF